MERHHGLIVITTVPELRQRVAQWKAMGERVALVPTMGALHEGHISLVQAAHGRNARIITSIFVNPTQFSPTEDFSKYPRTFDNDCAMLAAAKNDVVFAPGPAEMYPDGFVTTVTLKGPAKAGLEDAFRPTHFDGVATIVAKLFAQCRPDIAIFGQKDYQQLMVVSRMARDLDLGVEVIGAATMREKDGLAMSSRNRYLSEAERIKAVLVPDSLKAAIAEMKAGVAPSKAAYNAASKLASAGYDVDYVAVRHADTLNAIAADTTVTASDQPLRILVAAKIGNTRLIDNMAV